MLVLTQQECILRVLRCVGYLLLTMTSSQMCQVDIVPDKATMVRAELVGVSVGEAL